MLDKTAPALLAFNDIFAPHSATAVSEIASVSAEAELQRQLSVIKEVTDNHNDFVRILNEVTQSFLDTGVGRMPVEYWNWCGYREGTRWDWSHYISKLSSDMKRPFVFSVGDQLTIEKKAHTRALYAHLLLIAGDEGHTNSYNYNKRHDARKRNDISYSQTGGRITFNFNTDKGREMHRVWLEQTKTDPDFRKALRPEK